MSTDIPVEPGARLKYYREAKGVTQEEIGHPVGLTREAISRYERGVTPLSWRKGRHIDLMRAAAEILDVDEADLWGFRVQEQSAPVARETRRVYQKPHAKVPAPPPVLVNSLLDVIEGSGYPAQAKKQARETILEWFRVLSED